MKIHLLQSFEPFGPDDRQKELQQVWDKNEDLFDHRTDWVERPTFTEILKAVKPEYVTVIANSDISFDTDALSYFAEIPENTLWCLSRHDLQADGSAVLWNHADSSDTWVFRGAPPSIDIPYPLGTPGIDNKIPYEFYQAGWTVLNPSKTVITVHHHLVQWRSYFENPEQAPRNNKVRDRVPPPYKLIWPHEL